MNQNGEKRSSRKKRATVTIPFRPKKATNENSVKNYARKLECRYSPFQFQTNSSAGIINVPTANAPNQGSNESKTGSE